MAEVSSSGYGKNSVRLLRVRRDGECHSVCELRVNVELELASKWDYQLGDNRDVVATDSQKNTVLVFAQKNAVRESRRNVMITMHDGGRGSHNYIPSVCNSHICTTIMIVNSKHLKSN